MTIVDGRILLHEEIRLGKLKKRYPEEHYARITEVQLEEYKDSWTDPFWRKSSWYEYCCAWLLIERGEL